MQLFEMQGMLAGKCLPGDMLVKESLAEYLLRKINERNEFAAKLEIVNGLMDAATELNNLAREDVLGLVAENARMDKFVDECLQAAWQGGSLDGGEIQDIGLKHGLLREEVYSADQHESLVEDPSNFEDGDAVYSRAESPNTDAFTAELRAQGVDELSDQLMNASAKRDEINGIARAIDICEEFAANLRAGRKG